VAWAAVGWFCPSAGGSAWLWLLLLLMMMVMMELLSLLHGAFSELCHKLASDLEANLNTSFIS